MATLKRWTVLIYALFLGAAMLSTGSARDASALAFVAMTVTMWVFIGLYVSFAKWHRNREGKALLGFMVSVAAVCTQSSVNRWVMVYPWRMEVSAVLLFVTAVSMAWLTWVLAISLVGDRQPDPPPPKRPPRTT